MSTSSSTARGRRIATAKLSLFERLAVTAPEPAQALAADGDRQRGRPVGRRVRRQSRGRPARRARPTDGTAAADIRADAVDEDGGRGLELRRQRAGRRAASSSRLAGRFNVHNALAVVALGEALGPRSGGGARRARRRSRACPGRMERIERGQPFGVVVDYAHSPGVARDRASTSSRRSPPRGVGA